MRRRITPWLSVVADRPVNYAKFLEEAAALKPLPTWEPIGDGAYRAVLSLAERVAIRQRTREAADRMDEEAADLWERGGLSAEDDATLQEAVERARGVRDQADRLEWIEEGRNGADTDNQA
jgi:hypothetical protein